MPVFRVEKNKDYTVMSNYHLHDKSLSLKAKGLLSQMLSLPEEWDYTLSGLSRMNREGVDAIRSAIQELERAGYIHREFARTESGTFDGNIYTIYEKPLLKNRTTETDEGEEAWPPTWESPLWENATPDSLSLEGPAPENQVPESPAQGNPAQENPTPGNPTTGKPMSENPMQLNTNRSSTNRSSTKIPPIPPKGRGQLPPEVVDLLTNYLSDKPELWEPMEAFMEIRQAKKAVNSRRAVASLLKELETLSGGDRRLRVRLVNQSVNNSWKSVFPLTGARKPPAPEQEPRYAE